MKRVVSWVGLALATAVVVAPGVAIADEPNTDPTPEVTATADPSPTPEPPAEPTASVTPAPEATSDPDASPFPDVFPSAVPVQGTVPSVQDRAVANPVTTAESAKTTTQASSGAFTGTVKTSRAFVDANGAVTYEWPDGTRDHETDDPRTVTLKVSATKNLRSRQQVDVSWSGARPTGGTTTDPNSPGARDQEYPFVLLQCRGIDTSGKVPDGQVRLSPETCWSQTRPERYLEDSTNRWPPWRSDLWATPAQRARFAGAPYTLPWPSTEEGALEPPAACPKSKILAAHWLPFRAQSGKVYAGGPSDPDCAEVPPETDDGQSGVRTNTVYGVTNTTGSGSAKFTLWTKTENASLGCSSDVKCAIVAVPITGLSCDAWGVGAGDDTGLPENQRPADGDAAIADNRCRAADRYGPGDGRALEAANPASSGDLWWAESNWRHRITVPLTFAVSGDVCAVVNHEKPQNFFGSVGMAELTASWQPKFCTTKSLFSFTHVVSSDPAARNLVNSGGVEVAFGTAPPTEEYTQKVARAPLAVSGFAISYNIDDADRTQTKQLRLNARLLAKLLTTSYAANANISDNYAALASNPRNLLNDPEFQELNPTLRQLPRTAVFEAGSVMQTLSTDSDLTWALTQYINADPDARAWLNGDADEWGMTVNPTYKDVALPVTAWPLLDDWPLKDTTVMAAFARTSACFDVAPSPYLQLLSNPVGLMSTIVQNLQDSVSAVKIVCNAQDTSDRDQIAFKQQGRQTVGYRFVLGIIPLSSTDRYSLPAAELQTTEGSFVAPSDASLVAAAPLLKAGTTSAGWTFDYSALNTEAGAQAYPGTMPLYADIPTSGLDKTIATRLANFLCYAAGDGQVRGSANGELPTGYLPLTEANGLGALHRQTYAAAEAVRAQTGTVPAIETSTVTEADACDPSEETNTDSDTSSDASDSSTTTSTAVTATPIEAAPAATTSLQTTGPLVKTAGQQTWIGAFGPLFLLLMALLAGLGGSALRWAPHVSGWLETVRSMKIRVDE